MAEINVPVKLQIQNLQQLINDLQSKLSNLKVGSSGFKAIQNTITAIRGEIDKLSIQTAKPFIDAGQFAKAERSVERLEDEIEKVSLTMSRLKFSDLELTSEQKADIKAFEDQISSIRDKLRTVKNTAKDEFLKSALGQEWAKIDTTAFSKSLSQITNNIRSEAQKQKQELDDLQKIANDYSRAMAENQRIKDFVQKNTGDPLSQANLNDMYDQIFMTTQKGQFRYTNNGRNLLQDWLQNQLHLDDSVIAQIINKNVSAANVGAKLTEVLNNQMQKNQQVVDNNPNITADLAEKNAAYNQLLAILRQVGLSEQEVANAEQVLRAALGQTNNDLSAYKDKLTAIAQSNAGVQGTTSAMKSQLESLRSTLQQTNGEFIRMQRTQQSFNQMKMAVVNFMGFNQVLNLTKNAIRNAISHIKELDSVMNKISIVTDMSTSDLWNQVDAYSDMAQRYGTSIKGAYEVSQIYYQQGLDTNDVLTLTNETLKLAKISGLDYAQTTDYMTTALRGFKMEMSDAATVVDVYSNLAAHTAVSQEELAVAMSKTASSLQNVGTTFEEASAMIGTMVAVTRESATNIGSAMKSIASRYGELTKDPTKLVDEDGEAMAFNKVDAALQSVGISMKTVDGQFREFTDVIVELGEKWDQLESTQQRYIATQFAGNRQQSRFLALVSNVDLLKANMGYAEESEDTGTLQALKALDSIESKTEQVRVAYQQFYTTIGAESVWKGFLDGAKNVINTLNSFPKLFGKLPLGAIAAVASIINVIKSLGIRLISGFTKIFGEGIMKGVATAQGDTVASAESWFTSFINAIRGKRDVAKATGTEMVQAVNEGAKAASQTLTPEQLTGAKADKYKQITSTINVLNGVKKSEFIEDEILGISSSLTGNQLSTIYNNQNGLAAGIQEVIDGLVRERTELLNVGESATTSGSKLQQFAANHQGLAKGLQSFGSALHMAAMMIDTSQPGMKTLSGSLMAISGAATLAGIGMQALNHTLNSIPWMAIISGVFALINGISTLIITPEEKLKELEERAEELTDKAKEAKANYRTLDNSVKKLDELNEKRYESKEAAEEYQTAVDELAEKYPELIKGFDSMGNAILDAASMEETLTTARQKAAEAAYEAAKAEAEAAKQKILVQKNSISSKIGNVNTLRKENVQLARYQDEKGSWQHIAAYGGGDSLINYLTENEKTLDDTEHKLLNYIQTLDNQGNGVILEKLLKEATTNASNGNYNEAQNYIHLYRTAFNSMNWQMPDYQKKYLDDLTSAIKELTPLMDTIEIANKSMVNSWLRSSKYADMSFISSNSGLSNMFQSQLYEQANGDYSIANLEKIAHTLLNGPMQFWESLNEDEQTLFNKMFNDVKNYTKEDFKSEFGEKAFFPAIENLLETYYNPDISVIQKRANAALAQAMGKKADENGNFETITYDTEGITEAQKKLLWIASHQLTLTEEKFYNSVIDQYQSLNKSGYTDRANTLAIASADLYAQISNAPAEIEAQLWEIINTNGLSTIEGLENIKTAIANNEALQGYVKTGTLDSIANNIIPNISLEIQTATSDLLDTWENTSKELSSALNSGLSLKDADALIQKAKNLGLDIDLNDFQLEGDKLVLIGESFREYYNKLTEANEKATDEWQKRLTRAGQLLAGAGMNTWNYTKEDRALLESIGFDITNVDYYKNGALTHEGIIALSKAIDENYKELNNYNRAAQIAADQLLNSYNRSQGIYQLDVTAPILLKEELEEIAQGFNLKGEKLSKNDISQRAIKESLNSTYNTLISDVLAKGFENINLDDYEGLISHMDGTEIIRDEINLSGKYSDFVQRYAKLAGLSIDETNDLILQAMEKDREKTSEDLIKDFTFVNEKQFTASVDSLKELANAFDKSFSDLITRGVFVFDNTLQDYVVNVDALKAEGIDLTAVDNFKLSVQESVDQLFNAITSDVKGALGGSLDAKGVKALTDNLKRIGVTTDLQFTRTKDGYKLALTTAEKLYDQLKEIDSLSAQIVLDELNESIKDSVTSAKELEGVMRDVAEIRATTESDDFKFMDHDIPSGQNNPINYLENWSKAFKIMQEAGKAGKMKNMMDYNDFYNIITEMGNLAEQTGEIKLSGDTVLHNMEDAAALIEKGAAALSIAADGSIKVDLSKLGIDFSTGAADLKANVGEGIQEIANSEVKMLDSMIQLLETIVAMEELGDIDVEGNGIDFGEMFTKAFPDADGNWSYAWTQGMQNAAKNILEYADSLGKDSDLYKGLENVKVNGTSMRKIFEEARDNVNLLSEKDAQAYHAAVKAFYAAMQSGDYDLNNIMSSIKEVLAGTGFEGDIQVGDMTLTFHYGQVITKTKTGKFVGANGKEYNTADEAAWSQALSSLGVIGTNGVYTTNFDKTGKVISVEGELPIGQEKIKVVYNASGARYEGAGGTLFETLDQALESIFLNGDGDRGKYAQWTDNTQEGYSNAFAEWKIEAGYTVVPTLSQVDSTNINSTQVSNLAKKTIEELNAEWKQAQKNHTEVQFEVTYGFKMGKDGDTSQTFEDVKKRLGIASQVLNEKIDMSIEKGQDIFDVIKEDTRTLTLQVNIEKNDKDGVLDTVAKNTATKDNKSSIVLPKNMPVQRPESVIATPEMPETNTTFAPKVGAQVNQQTQASQLITPKPSTTYQPNEQPVKFNIEFDAAQQYANHAIVQNTIGEATGVIEEAVADAKQTIVNQADAAVEQNIAQTVSTTAHAASQVITEQIEVQYQFDETEDPVTAFTKLLNAFGGPMSEEYNAAFGEFIEEHATLSQDELSDTLTFEPTTDIDFQNITLPEGWSYDSSTGKVTTTTEWYIPVSMRVDQDEQMPETKVEEETNTITTDVVVNNEEAIQVLEETKESQMEVEEVDPSIFVQMDPGSSASEQQLLDIKTEEEEVDALDPNVSVTTDGTVAETASSLQGVVDTLSTIQSLNNQDIKITKTITPLDGSGGATGNIGMAQAKGTLMGELGPELYVSNGRYFVAGQNGPEFVDLASDAIVFNHLQTEQLLKHGMSSTRGQAVTNERNAVAFAHGNINGGPAMASAKQALAALIQLRNQWKKIADMSAKDFAGLGGSGGGGGGNKNDPKKFVKELEIWYNWLQKIAELEEKINYQESLRSKYAKSFGRDGASYAKSNLETLNLLREQAVVHQALVDAQEEYYKQRQKEINENNGPFSELYGINDYGQLYYKNAGFQNLSLLSGRDSLTGEGNLTAADQYATLVSMGFEKYMEFDSSGNKIDKTQDDWYVSAVQAFWDKIDSDKEEMQSLHDSIEEHKKAVVENQTKAYEILHEIEDNQMSVEDKVIKAIESTRQREIDELQKQRDAIEKSAQKLIDGLSEQLNREKDLYSQQETEDELASLQRRAAILRSSGGSQAEIASVEDEISQKQKDMYFDAQQRQIDSLQEAKDAQLERLDAQLALMTETLEYEKENGLLWGQVYEVMALSAEEIADFIVRYDSDYWGQSATRTAADYRDALYEADQFKTYQAEMKGGFDSMVAAFSDYSIKQAAALEKAIADMKAYTDASVNAVKADMAAAAAASSGGGGSNNGGSSSPSGGKTYSVTVNGSKKVFSDKASANSYYAQAFGGYAQTAMSNGASKAQAEYYATQHVSKSGFKEGGIVDFTGLTIVHGSSKRPESVLNAEQTEILRNDILGNSPNSLMNLLLDFKNAYSGISNGTSSITNNSSGITIEQAIVEMHVSKMSNDYDAQRAGEQALEKMVQIARKSQGQNRVGR